MTTKAEDFFKLVKEGKSNPDKLRQAKAFLEANPGIVTQLDEDNKNLLEQASTDPDAMRIILDGHPERADIVNDKNNNEVPLHTAALHGNKEVVALLFAANPKHADTKDNFGRTPLHYAALTGRTNAMELLLDKHPERAIARNNSSNTPLHVAAIYIGDENNMLAMQLLLKDHPERVLIKNDDGKTPADIAREALKELRERLPATPTNREKAEVESAVSAIAYLDEAEKKAKAAGLTAPASPSVAPAPGPVAPKPAPSTPISANNSVAVVDLNGLPDALRMSGTGANTKIAEVLAEPESSVAQREARAGRPRAFLIVPDKENPGQIKVISGYRDGNNFVQQNATRVLVNAHGANTYLMNNSSTNMGPIAIGTNTNGSPAVTTEDFNRNYNAASPPIITLTPPVTVAPATPSTRVAAGPSAAAPSGPAPSQARQNWDATVATIRQSLSHGVSPTTGTEVANALRSYANNPANNLQGTNKDAMLTAANNIQKMSPDQIKGMLSQPAGWSGKTVEQALTSNTPRDNSVAVTSLMRQSLRGAPGIANGPQQAGQPAQPRVGFNNAAQNYLNSLRADNAQEAGAALQQLAEQQQMMANSTRNPNLAKTAKINMEAARNLQGPNGQQALEQQLSKEVGSGKTVRDMLDSPNKNAQNAAGAFVANANSRTGQQYNRNTMSAMQLAARMEAALGGNAAAANHGNNHGVNGGHDAHNPAGPAGGPGGARRGGAAAGVGG